MVYVVGLGMTTTGVTYASVCTLETLAWHDMNAGTNAPRCALLNA